MAALRLSSHATAGVVMRIVVGVPLAGLWVGCARLSYDWTIVGIPLLLANPPDSVTSTLNWSWAWLWVFLFGLGGPAMLAMLTLHTFRARDTLDGTVLTVRGILHTRSADLAVAHVRGETKANGPAAAAQEVTGRAGLSRGRPRPGR